MTTSDSIEFGIIGGGWRAEFFLRIARALPDRFKISGIMVRNPAKARTLEEAWSVRTHQTIDELLAGSPRFVVVSVPQQPQAIAPEYVRLLAARNVPVLCETPPAGDIDELLNLCRLAQGGARIQVAEQYHLQPHHAARLNLIKQGRIGKPTFAHLSIAHDYHGVSLMRRYLGIAFENARITARRFESPIVAGPGRGGLEGTAEKLTVSDQILATLDFGDKLCTYDFTLDQYFSWIRGQRVLVRGERGEVREDEVSYLTDFQTPVTIQLRREDAGARANLEGYFHKGITVGDQWLYRNAYQPGTLTDDEIAIADCLTRMSNYVETGEDFYSLAEAAQDQYLALCIQEALASGSTVETETMGWADRGP